MYYAADWLGDTVATVEKHYVAKAEARAGMRNQFRMHRMRLPRATNQRQKPVAVSTPPRSSGGM